MRLFDACANRMLRLFTCVIVGMFVILGGMDTANTANNCTGATYYNATSDTCVACPTGYTDNTDAGKTSVNQCQIHCDAGTYLAGLDGYTILEWLENTGTAYVDTGVTHALETSKNIKGEFRIGTPTQVTANSNIIGTQSPSNNPKGYSVGWDKGFKIWIQNGNKKLTGPNHALSAGGIHDVEFRLTKDKKAYLKYDGSETNALSYGGVQSLNTIHLFEGGNHQSDRYFIGRIYYLRIYEDDVLTHNFIPVRRNSDNALGVYDTEATSNNFAEATGTLVAGNAVTIAQCSAVGAGQYAATAMVNFGSASATPGTIAAGYFSTGGATTATPTANDCVGNNTCGKCTTDTTTGRTTYTDSAGGATSCSVCPELTGDLASRIISYDYYPSATHGNGIDGCRVNLSDTDPIATVSSGISCAYNATDNTYGGVNSSCQIAGTALSCPAGYPNISANQPEWDGTYLNFTSVDTMNGRLCETPGHTVTYDCGTGTGTAPASTTAVPGSPFTPAMNTCTKSGYVFAGWAVSGTNDVKAQGVAFTWDYGADKTFTAQWTEAGFAVTTTNLDANDTIKFNLSATGTFTVKCGTDGTLGGTGVSGTTITRNDTTPATYTCTYSTGGEKTITFDGVATGYSTSDNVAAISFYLASGGTQAKIASVDGKLGVVFPTLGQNAGEQPQFYQTFRGCSNLGSISATPFNGVTGARTQMFKETFRECTSLTSLPTGLFGGVSGAAEEMFMDTFNGCTGLISISTTLFGNVSGAAPSMFRSTFKGCTGLTSISVSLFSGVSGSAPHMFEGTFFGCSSLASIPANLFGGVSGSAEDLFYYVFRDCTSLTSIPSGLFGNVSGAASRMFGYAFYNCSSLTSIPTGLFNGVTGAANYLFDSTFNGCSSLTSIPSGLFSGVSGAAAYLFNNTFYGCSSLTSIPSGLFSGVSGAAANLFSSTFYNCSKITSIPADLFSGVYGAAGSLFNGTFRNCSKITSIPADLFSGVYGAANDLFNATFMGTSITSIPADLFSGVTGSANNEFRNTFSGCSSLTSIPTGLFDGVYGAANNLFDSTFYGCSSLTSIPSGLFSGVSGAATSLFINTFRGCSKITSIPADLFSGVYGAANNLFNFTFYGCSSLTSIPSGLFSGVSGAAANLFNGTFQSCSKITSIPADLFSGVTGSANNEFANTFNGCSLLAGYIPPSTFAGLIANGSPTLGGSNPMWTDTFKSTALATTCPADTTAYTTNYEGDTNGTTWNGRVSCTPTTTLAITLDAGTGNTASVPATVYLDYGTGWYSDSTGQTSITSLTTLPSKSGYAFGGFYTEPDGVGIRITDENGNFLTNDTALHAAVVPTTAYAHYGTGYTVTYSCGTGTGTAPTTTTTVGGISFTTAANTCTKSGEVFLGWAISDTNDVKQPGDTFTWGYTENKTLTAQWAPFSVTTRAFASSGTVNFTMSATGTFLVNCGVNGTLSGDGVSGNVITRSSTSSSTYTCTYTSNGARTLSFTGTATGYSTSDNVAAISFYVGGTQTNITAINGSLGAVFPTLGQNSGQQPHFYQTFRASNITSIPATLFNGISGAGNSMFRETFVGCSSLTSIPAGLFDGVYGAANELFNSTFMGTSITSIPSGLFSGVSGAAERMFGYTFKNCTSLTSIPADLFSGVSGAATRMFLETFSGCSSLASIPAGLFDGVYGAANELFNYTFLDCSSLASIPSGLFSGVSGAAGSMFANTFKNCSSLTSIPMGLFAGASGSANSLFNSTFMGCTGITAIPAYLFSGVTGSGDSEFKNTFNGCTSLTGYIPPSTFAGLIANGSPTKGGSNPMWTDTFANTALDTVCPSGTTQYTTNYEGDTNGTTWNGRVSCTPTTTVAITLDAGTGNTASVPATVYLDYGTGWYSDSTGQTSITSLTTLPSKSGYIFGGFYTEPNGYGVQVIDENGNFHTDDTILHAAVIATTLYAHFGTTYTVTYSCGAGTGTAPTATTVIGGTPFTTATSTCSREGYAFSGWAVSDTNDVKQSDDTFRWEYTENKTLTAQWAPFGVTTTNLNKGDTIRFTLSATGTFTVNCGAGGWLSGSGVSGNTITRNDTTSATYTCTYIYGGVKTLSFTGPATGYSTSDEVAAISFYLSSNGGTQAKIAAINGTLGTVFPTLGQSGGQQPQFTQTFYGTGITSIPATLFNGISGAGNSMFRETFRNCTGITSIPATLFSGISGAANGLFSSTFNGCSSLTSIPATLFSGVSGAASKMFFYTFEKCSSLASIPSTLFSGVSGSDSAMFEGTFKSCTSITSIPEDLFSGVTGSADNEFKETFYGCTSLGGYIPPSTFAGLIANGSPTLGGGKPMWDSTFKSTALLTSCPSDKAPFTTGYEGSENGTTWNGKVSCFIPSTATITLNAGTGSTTVAPSSVYFKYAVGWYSDSGTQTSIASLTTLPTKTGYTFGGFYTSSDGTGTQVIDASGNFLTTEEVLRFTGNSTTVYAKWTPIEYTVTYSCGTGTGTPPTVKTIAYDAQFTVATNPCTKSGEVFTGWAISDTNAVKQSTDVFTWNYTENKTLTAQWAPFAVTTTNLNANDTITFTLSAQGVFTVDCGDGGTLSSSVNGEVDGSTIKRGGTTPAIYTCTYATGGVKKIGFNGSATEYSTSTTVPAISFYQNPGGTQARIAAIDGSLGAVFPTLGQTNGQQPRFNYTFENTNITSIPATLFSGVTGATDFMFAATFSGCPVTSIPSNLFSGITGGANSLFKGTFQSCTLLTSIPANLFSGITMANESMFAMTFGGCTSLGGYIPPSTFSGLIANNHPVKSDMWNKTFDNTLVVTSCPVDTRQFTTGYEGSGTETWDGRVSCFVPTPMVITLDAGTDNVPSVPASVYLVFGDGWYSDSGAHTSIASLTTLPTKTGYTFGGYYTEQNGVGSQVVTAKGQFVTDNSVLIALTSASSVYAKWTPIEYSVTYSCGTGATGTTPAAATAVYDTQFTPATNTCFKSGSVFNGWAVSNTNDMQQPDTAFTWNYAENKTLTAQWTAFIVTTKSLSANSTFSFAISASGVFTVDCGTDGTLSGDGVSGNTITRNNTTSAVYTCTYTTGGVKTIKFDGAATGYTTDMNSNGDFVLAAISFASSAGGTPGRIAAIDGSLGAIFPTLGQNANQQPRFYRTFENCNSLQSVPATLFTGVTGAIYGMFAFTFTMCTGMKSIPATLFSGITGNAGSLFYATFAGCRSVGAIPATLFSGITGHADALFFYTFQQCYKVTSIPETLFSGVTGADVAMFYCTFMECSGLLSIPAGLFSGISGSASEMFTETFLRCSKLVSIPATLFSGVTGSATSLFRGTFRECSALTSIPTGLFSGISGSATKMFWSTFLACSSLTSIPATLFSGVTGTAEALFDSTFKNCASLTTLPDTLFSGVSGAADKLFHETFSGCTSLASIPATLFSGVSGAASTMFNHVFYNCTSLVSIPATLFSGVSGAAESMFDSAFSGCSGLTSIPATLFSGVRGAAGGMFAETFLGCSNITSIPEDLFSGVSGSAIWMFTGVFAGCGKVTSIPPRLFRGITGAAEGMMEGIFRGTSITSIPQGLFSGIYGSAAYLFQNTFRDCKSLTSIPDDLFSGITGSAANMFETTFYNCTSLSGYIPPATFAGLIENNHPVTDDMWLNTFNGTALYTSCPSGTIQYTTGYEGETNGTTWNGKVSCVNENLLCAAGEYLPANGYQCTLCPINSYCTGGTYPFNTQSATGIASCASGLYAPVGMWESAQCGRILHIGDNVIYLRSTRQTNPSLNIDMDNDGTPDYFGNMTTADVVMNSGTERKLKISFGGQTYSVYDDTVTLPE